MEWKEIEIGTLVTLRQGFAINKKSKHYLSEEKTDLYLLRIADMRDRSFSVYIDDTIPQQFIANKQDIIYSRTGQVGLVFTDLYGVVHNNCFTVTPIDENTLHRNYLLYVLKSDSFYRKANSLASGSAQPDLSHSAFKSITIPLPPIPMQKRIANILSSLDAKIENNNKINANLEAQAAALFKSWFVDFEPFRDGEFVESELGMIPKGWKVGTLGEIAKISKMSINPAKSPDCLYSHYSLPAFDNGKLPQKQLGSEIKSNKFTFQPFSILLSKLNPDIKRIWFVDTLEENPICSTEFIPVLPNLSRDFAFTYLCVSNEHYYAKLLSGVTGATNSHQRLKPEDVINLQIPINESVFEMFAKTVTSLLIQINANIYQNKSVAQIRDTLLPKLMSGEIDLDNISI